MSALAVEPVTPWPSRHALEVMRRRRISWGEVVETVEHPHVVYPSNRHGREHSVYQRGSLAVVLSDVGVVVTVLFTARHQWTDADVRARRVSP